MGSKNEKQSVPQKKYILRYVNTEDYQKANLKDARLAISIAEAGELQPTAQAGGFEEEHDEHLNDKHLLYRRREEGAAGTRYEIISWVYSAGSRRAGFELLVVTSNVDNYYPRKYEEFKREKLLSLCREIIREFHFIKSEALKFF